MERGNHKANQRHKREREEGPINSLVAEVDIPSSVLTLHSKVLNVAALSAGFLRDADSRDRVAFGERGYVLAMDDRCQLGGPVALVWVVGTRVVAADGGWFPWRQGDLAAGGAEKVGW